MRLLRSPGTGAFSSGPACLAVLLQLDENVDKGWIRTFPPVFYAADHLVKHRHAKFENVESKTEDTLEHHST